MKSNSKKWDFLLFFYIQAQKTISVKVSWKNFFAQKILRNASIKNYEVTFVTQKFNCFFLKMALQIHFFFKTSTFLKKLGTNFVPFSKIFQYFSWQNSQKFTMPGSNFTIFCLLGTHLNIASHSQLDLLWEMWIQCHAIAIALD